MFLRNFWYVAAQDQQVHTAFLEDLTAIKAQQANMDRFADTPQVDFKQDAGGIQARRIVDNLLAEERAGGQARATA